MPNVSQKKFNKGALIALAFIAAMVLVMVSPIEQMWVKIAIDVALILIYLFLRRGYIYYYRAAVAYRKRDWAKIFPLMEKALKAGVDFERQLSIGSLYIQSSDDAERGVQILEAVIRNPKAGDFAKRAMITCSMGYWRLGRQDDAIDILQTLRDDGFRDDNLSINLETYLLEKGELKKAKEAITENRRDNTENNGLMDNRGWYCIQMGQWQKAREIYDELVDERNAKFPEAYLHAAQVSVHYNDMEQAVDRLGWGLSKQFNKTCLTTKDYVEKLMLGLGNPATREAFAKAMEENHVAVSNAKTFPGLEKAVPYDESSEGAMKPKDKPKYKPMAKTTSSGSKETSKEDESLHTDVDDDDREPNTDLDESDVVLAKKLGYYEADVEEQSPHTAVDDDDDREPNTDLGDDD